MSSVKELRLELYAAEDKLNKASYALRRRGSELGGLSRVPRSDPARVALLAANISYRSARAALKQARAELRRKPQG